MNWNESVWITAALVGLVPLITLAAWSLANRSKKPSSPRGAAAVQAALLAAAATSTFMLISMAAKIKDILPRVTAVDVAALAFMGVITGVFLTLGLTSRWSNSARN